VAVSLAEKGNKASIYRYISLFSFYLLAFTTVGREERKLPTNDHKVEMGLKLDHPVCCDIILWLASDFPVTLSVSKEWRRRMQEANKDLTSCKRRVEILRGCVLDAVGVDWCKVYRTVWCSNVDLPYYCGKIGDLVTFQALFKEDYSAADTAMMAAIHNDRFDMVKGMIEGECMLWSELCKRQEGNVDVLCLYDIVAYLDGDVEVLRGRCGDKELDEAIRVNKGYHKDVEEYCNISLLGKRVNWCTLPAMGGENNHDALIEVTEREDVNAFRVLLRYNIGLKDLLYTLNTAQGLVLSDTAVYKEIEQIKKNKGGRD